MVAAPKEDPAHPYKSVQNIGLTTRGSSPILRLSSTQLLWPPVDDGHAIVGGPVKILASIALILAAVMGFTRT